MVKHIDKKYLNSLLIWPNDTGSINGQCILMNDFLNEYFSLSIAKAYRYEHWSFG